MALSDYIYGAATGLYNFGYNAVTGQLSPYQVGAIKQQVATEVTAAGGTDADIAAATASIDSALGLNGQTPGFLQLVPFVFIAVVLILASGKVLKRVV